MKKLTAAGLGMGLIILTASFWVEPTFTLSAKLLATGMIITVVSFLSWVTRMYD